MTGLHRACVTRMSGDGLHRSAIVDQRSMPTLEQVALAVEIDSFPVCSTPRSVCVDQYRSIGACSSNSVDSVPNDNKKLNSASSIDVFMDEVDGASGDI